MKRILVVLFASALAAAQAEPVRFHIGTFPARGSAGIYTATLDPETSALSAPVVAAEVRNANWITWHPRGDVLYSVGERTGESWRTSGEVVAWAPRADGTLAVLNRQSTGMGSPCHLGVNRGGTLLVAANYGEGAVLAFPLGPAGEVGPVAQTVRHTGSGPNASRQKEPHAHGVTFDPAGGFVFIPDLGIDRLVGYRVSGAAPRIEASSTATAETPPGAGPRHLAFHPDGRFAYSVNELDATITQFSWDPAAAALRPVRTVKSLPADATMPNTSAEIAAHPNGRFLYVSNRGHDSIAVFVLDPATGAPTLLQNEPSGGRAPRGFALDPAGRFLVSANQDTDRIITLRIDPATGRLTPTGHGIDVPAPVCILFPVK